MNDYSTSDYLPILDIFASDGAHSRNCPCPECVDYDSEEVQANLSADEYIKSVAISIPDEPEITDVVGYIEWAARDLGLVSDVLTEAERVVESVPEPFPYKDETALESALERLGVSVRYNLRSQRPEMRRDGKEWHEISDRQAASLKREIADNFTYQTTRGNQPLRYGRETWREYLDALLFDREVDPFLDWLESRPAWDGVQRLDHWLGELFDVDDKANPLLRWSGRYLFLGAITRTYEPGAKLDESPVLIGPQGIGKSTVLAQIFPPEFPEWFADGLHLAQPDKQRVEALQGRVLVEMSEMAGSTRAELESLKAFMTRQNDGVVRLAYRRNPETMRRRCVMVGTTNDAEPLPNDDTGNRRFVVVKVNGGSPAYQRRYLREWRDQLWAEALALYRDGVEARLPDTLKDAQSQANEKARRRDDVLESEIDRWLTNNPTLVAAGFETATIVSGIGLVTDAVKVSQRDSRRVTRVLRGRGFRVVQQRVGNRRPRLWTLD